MSNQINKYDRAVSNKEPKSEIEKIQQYYFQEDAPLLEHDTIISLTKEQETRRKILEKVYGWSLEMSTSEVIEEICKTLDVKKRQAYKYYRDALKVFGTVLKIEKESRRAIAISKHEAQIKAINEDNGLDSDKKYELVLKHMIRLEVLQDLESGDSLSADEIFEKLKLPDVMRTTDPKALRR